MPLTEWCDLFRLDVARQLDPKQKSSMGQFMTPSATARFMASLFGPFAQDSPIHLLDAGAGTGSLTAAFLEELCKRERHPNRVSVSTYEVDPILIPYLSRILNNCTNVCSENAVQLETTLNDEDFLEASAQSLRADLFADKNPGQFTHAILNPPYRKIQGSSNERQLMRAIGIETSNLYTAFVAAVVKLLAPGGELVAITPRSFCNGVYFRSFRQFFLEHMRFVRIHVFDSRQEAFGDDKVLQENIVFHAIKQRSSRRKVIISSSTGPDFGSTTLRKVTQDQVVNPTDQSKVIHIAVSDLDQAVIERLSAFSATLPELGLQVSTGRVVDFRATEYLRKEPSTSTFPLIYSGHFKNGYIEWPKLDGKKPNALSCECWGKDLLLPSGIYTVVKRFSAKEEKRRIVAALYDPERISAPYVGFENHLNVFHQGNAGLDGETAKGLCVYLNTTLVDEYFRQFNGHTQVNATDLRMLNYPTHETLRRLGSKIDSEFPTQREIDELIEGEITDMIDTDSPDPVRAKEKIDEALSILKNLGLPRAQQNLRSALCLLAIVNLRPHSAWSEAEASLIGITPIMNFCRDNYGKNYAPNTRETIRRQTMHQFVDAGLALYNPDKPDRPVNSPKACYQIEPKALELIKSFGKGKWGGNLKRHLDVMGKLSERYAKKREMQLVPVQLANGSSIELSPGAHSDLIRAIVEEFAPRFLAGSVVVYVGDTGDKWGYFDRNLLTTLGVSVGTHGKMPDAVLYQPDKNWLVLVEAVTSHGPVDPKRHAELSRLFAKATAGVVYVTTFPDRGVMARYLNQLSWETEVWVQDHPTHLIHFDGERFLGPYDG